MTAQERIDALKALKASSDKPLLPVKRLGCAAWLSFVCDECETLHELNGPRIAGLRTLTCSVCGAKWGRR